MDRLYTLVAISYAMIMMIFIVETMIRSKIETEKVFYFLLSSLSILSFACFVSFP